METLQTTLLYRFPKTNDEEVRFSLKRSRDRVFFDIRVWFCASGTSDYHPTRKGLYIPVEKMEAFRQGMKALDQGLEASEGPAESVIQDA